MTRFYWGVYDAVSAAVVDEAGGEGLWLSGLCCSAACGLPDTELAGLGELLACLRTLRRVSRLPVWIDCGTGFGSPSNLAVAADDLQRAGADGLCFEDKVFPKRNTFSPVTHELEEVGKFCQKIERVKRRLESTGCQVIARTEALTVGDPLPAALERAAAYADAGADALFLSSPAASVDAARDFLRAWRGRLPVVLLPTSYRLPSGPELAELEELGLSVVIYANQLLRSSVAAMHRLLAGFAADPTAPSGFEEMVGMGELLRLTDRQIV
jgi:phosphoenolpyruvate phosphomutase